MPEMAATDSGTAPKPAYKVRIHIDEHVERTVNERTTRHPTVYVRDAETQANADVAHYYRQQRLPNTGGTTMSGGHDDHKPAAGGGSGGSNWIGYVVLGAIVIWFLTSMPSIFPPWPPRIEAPPRATWLAPVVPGVPVTGQDRNMQQQLCEDQAAKRRALGLPSIVVWDSPYTCRATGGYTESGRIP